MLKVMPASEYYGDPCEKPSLSQSTAHTLLSRSPYHAWLEHPKLGGAKRESSKAMDDGTILHSMLLGTTCDIEWLDFPDYRTKAAQNARDEAIFNGMIPKLMKEHHRLDATTHAVIKQLLDLDISLTGESEGVILWTERDNQNREIHCKARLDLFDGVTITDLKSTNDAHPDKCLRRIIDAGYDMQAAVYVDAVTKQLPELAGRVKFRNIFFETEPPYLVTVVTQGETLLTLGRNKWSRAVNLWSHCLHENSWPAYGEVRLDAPAWALQKEMEAA